MHKTIRKLWRRLSIDLGDYHQTVFLAGTGRSGTTWVEELINYRNNYRIMFEPFHSKKTKILNEWNHKQYIRPDNREERYLRPATNILNGKIRSTWVDQNNHKMIAQKRIIKDIRANLFLKWIKQNFPDIKIILLLRHPCAVVHSILRIWFWDPGLYECLTQEELMLDYLNPFKTEIEAAKDRFDINIFSWCIECYVPLKQFKEGDIHIVFYESLCVEPEHTIEKLLDFVGETYSPEILDVLSKPSATIHEDSAVVTGTDLIDTWRKHITDKQLSRAIEILTLFGLEKIYSEDSLPLLSGEEALGLFET